MAASPAPKRLGRSFLRATPRRRGRCASFSTIPASAPSFPACASAATSKPISPPVPRAPSLPRSTNSYAPTAGTATPLPGHNESPLRQAHAHFERSARFALRMFFGARNLSSVFLEAPCEGGEGYLTRFVSGRVRRASGNARPVRALTPHDRRDLAACCGVRPQSPAPPAPRLFACPRSSSRRRSHASFRPRSSPASAHTSHPDPLGGSTFARKFALSPGRSWSFYA